MTSSNKQKISDDCKRFAYLEFRFLLLLLHLKNSTQLSLQPAITIAQNLLYISFTAYFVITDMCIYF